ncbi:hypothetical protein Droror1_Dr00003417 [Drosera rotundifolia]
MRGSRKGVSDRILEQISSQAEGGPIPTVSRLFSTSGSIDEDGASQRGLGTSQGKREKAVHARGLRREAIRLNPTLSETTNTRAESGWPDLIEKEIGIVGEAGYCRDEGGDDDQQW